ncbi:MAG: DegV family protein [Oscillospiraceae bacterium]
MEKIKFIADTASDITDQELAEYAIGMPSVPITIDGESYFERKSFGIQEFYTVLAGSKEIPATSRVPEADYLELYRQALAEGYTDIISVTINAGGSGTHTSAVMAAQRLFDKNPEAKDKLGIHVVDSRSYCRGYGSPVVKAAQMARDGKTATEILAFLDDWFNCVEIYLGCYTLEYAKKSGRISAAAAFVGEVLGMRPVISLIDGETKTEEKVRGDKKLALALFNQYKNRRVSPDDDVCVVCGEEEAHGKELQSLLEKELGRPIPIYFAGASITINAGPRIAAVVLKGKPRH